MEVIVKLCSLIQGDSVGLDLRLFRASHNLLLVPAGAPLYTFVSLGLGEISLLAGLRVPPSR